MNCAIQCAGSAADIIAETAEVVKKIKESLAENPEAEIAFAMAISAAIMDMSFGDLTEKIMKMKEAEDS